MPTYRETYSNTFIDYTNPLSRGLAACYVPNHTGVMWDLCGIDDLTPQVNSAWGVGPVGRVAMVSTVTNSGSRLSSPSDRMRPKTQVSVFWYGTYVGAPTQGADFFMSSYTNSNTNPFAAWGVGYRDSAGSTAARFYWNDGSAFQRINGTSANANKNFCVLGTLRPSQATLYVNGVVEGTLNSVGTIVYSNSEVNYHNAPSYATSKNPNVKGYIAILWNRCLTPNEATLISKDPFRIFTGLKINRRFFVGAAATVATNINKIERKLTRGLLRGIGRGR